MLSLWSSKIGFYRFMKKQCRNFDGGMLLLVTTKVNIDFPRSGEGRNIMYTL